MKFDFSQEFSKNSQLRTFVKIRLVGDELIHSGERMDRQDEVKSQFS
jgi:hypothetical protein